MSNEDSKTASVQEYTTQMAALYPDVIRAFNLSESMLGSDTLYRALIVTLGVDGQKLLEVCKVHTLLLERYKDRLDDQDAQIDMYRKCVEQQNLNISVLLQELRDVKEALAFIFKGHA